jgi:hypothetical protein
MDSPSSVNPSTTSLITRRSLKFSIPEVFYTKRVALSKTFLKGTTRCASRMCSSKPSLNSSSPICPTLCRSCQRNRPVYSTFHLHNFFDTSVTNYKTWTDYKTALDNFSFAEDVLEILSPSLQLHLQALATLSAVDFTPHRSRISGVLTRKDLTSFAEQLNTVARQLSDPSSSKKFDDLAAALRRLIQKEAARLSDLRDSILYKLTALEVFIHPLSRQANRSLSHLKDVQFFLDNRRGWIVEKVGRGGCGDQKFIL